MRKKLMMFCIIISLIFIISTYASSQYIAFESLDLILEKDEKWFENNPNSLPIWLTQDELERLDEIGRVFKGTSPPTSPVRMPAEFEPMQGVLIRYPFGISYQIIAEMSEDVEVITIVASESEMNYVFSQYQSNGVNIANCDFLIAPSNSYWTRDYGPWFIFDGDDEQGIADHIYNRPRPYDDAIPTKFGNWQGISVYGLSLEHAGGNYMTDGQGIAVSTDLVWEENPGYSHSEIEEMMKDYCGIETYHVVPDPLGAYIKHIDCWAKFLSPDTIMIIKSSTSHSHYEDFEDAAEYFENQTSCYGTPYNVVRVYTHMSEPYINSLILNNKVLVPISGSSWDDDAISSYETSMPGYEVLGFTGSWDYTDALHCRAKGIVDRYMLYIEHTPLSGTQSSPDGYEIQAMIYPYSFEDVTTAETFVRFDGGSWGNYNMEYLGNYQYRYIIPQQQSGTIVDYYIHAEDDSGRSETHPYIGAPGAHSFVCEVLNDPPQIISINGTTSGKVGVEYEYCIEINDTEQDDFYVFWDWGNGDTSGWLGSFEYIEEICETHTWDIEGKYTIKAKVKDIWGGESDWAELEVTMPKNKIIVNNQFLQLIQKISNPFSILIKSTKFFQIYS